MIPRLIDPGVFLGAASLDDREKQRASFFELTAKGAAEGELVEEVVGKVAPGPGNFLYAFGQPFSCYFLLGNN